MKLRVASLRIFDPANQRSIETKTDVEFLLGGECDSNSMGLLSLLPDDIIIFWENLDEIEERVEHFLDRLNNSKVLNPQEINDSILAFNSIAEVRSDLSKLNQITWGGLTFRKTPTVDFGGRQPDPFPEGLSEFSTYLGSYINDGLRTWIATDTEGEQNRLDELLTESNLDQVHTFTPSISGGFVSKEMGLAVLTAHEVFNRRRLRSRHTRFRRRSVQFDRASLRKGDVIVHTEYGIGIYEGLQRVNVRSQPRECLRIKYRDSVLYVRVENFGLVEKYVASDAAHPVLSKLGGTDWARTKKRTRKAIKDMAAELIRLYAERKIVKGHSFIQDTRWQTEMEDSFEFEDTPDQVTATVDVKADLEAEHPMDRLLCGDVGFGKTEIAIRAAFKVIQESMQVAILVPTTILAQQHWETFRARLSAYPVNIEVLSRFRTKKEQTEIVKKVKHGEVDIIIGTHRLLSKDVAFKKLGLLIIDEEHRFGVRHKEKLKQFKTNVDVLTLTATPIPRTLHLALMGARDTSQINTPPVDRLPVQTEVHSWSEDLIRESILREIDRQGQIFFVHNRVQSIYSVKNMLERVVPGLRYGVAHGQMPENKLEKVISDFLRNRYDVLVTTMIIESGIDMPNVNTLIVNRADRFGLAQLYQLRGRIGRSNRQAYAYLLAPPKLVMTPESRRRLSTITELTELGSGMKIALRDLEIRGAGNVLGSQQSGYINAVGFELYSRLLNEEVSKLKKDKEDETTSTLEDIPIDYDGPALLPADYIEDGDVRYDFYRRLTNQTEIENIQQLEDELKDRFGTPPESAGNLLELIRLKILCRLAGITKLKIEEKLLIGVLDLPADPAEMQKTIGRLVAAADPEKIEFRSAEVVDLIYRYNSDKPLQNARKFLQRITRKGILQGYNIS